jgi:TRAP-type C4-dicarboxylate transport system permease small subunit
LSRQDQGGAFHSEKVGHSVRATLTVLYRVSGGVAGAFLVAICAIVAAQVLGNVVDRLLIMAIGEPIGIIIPAYSDFAGFFLAASTFLALAYTLTRGEHVRVRLVLSRLPGPARRWLELWCAGFGAVGAGVATYYAGRLTYNSWRFGDTVTGMVPVPLWIPQLVMIAGLAILTVAFADLFLSILITGHPPYRDRAEPREVGDARAASMPSEY